MAQNFITGVYPFQDDPAKSYSAYIPSNYNEDIPNTTIIAFHPFNTNRWDAESWRDTLFTFAESVNAILICPDGGADGKVDDAIDTAFTSFIFETMQGQYNIDKNQTYLCGFSWGGRAAYTYGLHRPNTFKGYLITGAAVNGTTEINNVLTNATQENFYLIHGANDNLNTRHTIISNALIDNEACVESNILTGVGHTIDYPNRNQILKDGFEFLVSNSCILSSNDDLDTQAKLQVYPNPSQGYIYIDSENAEFEVIQVLDTAGNKIGFTKTNGVFKLNKAITGIYFLHFKDQDNNLQVKKIIVD